MSEIILEARNLSLEYRSKSGFLKTFTHKALDNVSFQLKKGEVLGLTGRNGAGKSTLLKVLVGVLEPDSGEVIIAPNVSYSLLSLGLGFNPDLSGRDNAYLSCMLNGLSKADAKQLLGEIKDFSELGQFFEQPIRTYSSGMRSRLGFACGVLTEVDILMIDEVLSVGDKKFKEKAESVMLNKLKNNKSVIFVSHNAQQIKRLCDRTLEL